MDDVWNIIISYLSTNDLAVIPKISKYHNKFQATVTRLRCIEILEESEKQLRSEMTANQMNHLSASPSAPSSSSLDPPVISVAVSCPKIFRYINSHPILDHWFIKEVFKYPYVIIALSHNLILSRSKDLKIINNITIPGYVNNSSNVLEQLGKHLQLNN